MRDISAFHLTGMYSHADPEQLSRPVQDLEAPDPAQELERHGGDLRGMFVAIADRQTWRRRVTLHCYCDDSHTSTILTHDLCFPVFAVRMFVHEQFMNGVRLFVYLSVYQSRLFT